MVRANQIINKYIKERVLQNYAVPSCIFGINRVSFFIAKKYTYCEGGYMGEIINVQELFGENVFNDKVMLEKLPKKCTRNFIKP